MSDNIIRTGLNLMNTAFNGSGGIVISGEAVKGGYFVTPSIEITYEGEEGKIPDYACIKGTLCYCSTDKKFYQFDGTNWVNKRWDELVPALDTLIASDAGKSVRTIANEELAAQLLSGNADASFKTLQELAAWIEDHPEDAQAINEAIQALQQDVEKLREDLNNEITNRTAADAELKSYIEDLLFNTELVIDANLLNE